MGDIVIQKQYKDVVVNRKARLSKLTINQRLFLFGSPDSGGYVKFLFFW